MSCGRPHETPCEQVLEQVWLFWDGELPDPDCVLIRTHLEECPGCLDEYDLEHVVKALVTRCGGGDVAPERLRAKVVATVHSVSVDQTGVRTQSTRIEYRAE